MDEKVVAMSKHNLRVIDRNDGKYLIIKEDASLLQAMQATGEIAIPLWEVYAAKRIYVINRKIEGLHRDKVNLEKGLSENGEPIIVQRLADEIAMKGLDE